MKSRPSLTDLIKQRHAADFVGRGSHVSTFETNLALPVDQRRFVFSISGQAGVGKSYLIRRFRSVADSAGCITALTNDDVSDIPLMLARLAGQLKLSTKAFDEFLKRYEDYRQRREELEGDPDLPPGAIAAAAKTVARVGLKLGRRTPAVGAVLDFVDEDSAADQAAEWASFLARKLSNKDDVQLLRDPKAVLTPLFVAGLARLDDCPAIVLFLDTYEKTASWIDEWLRELLNGHFGDLPAHLIICIAGQYELDPALWALYTGVIAKVPLDVFTDDEAREYLARRGIIDPALTATVLQLSNRLPLLVATLAESASRRGDLTEASLTAVQRFLKWIGDAGLREIAINASLPRRLNEDVLREIAPHQEGTTAIDWLRRLPFVQDGFRYHDMVRGQMLRLKLRQAPTDWQAIHRKIANYYRSRAEQHLKRGGTKRDTEWRAADLEAAYHTACELGDSAIQFAAATFAEAFENSSDHCKQIVTALRSASQDSESPALVATCDDIERFLHAYDTEQYASAAEQYVSIVRAAKGTPAELRTQLRHGMLLRYGNRPATAEKVLSAVIETASSVTSQSVILYQAFLARSWCYRDMEDGAAALADLDQAAILRPQSQIVAIRRGQVLRALKRYDESLDAFAKAYSGESHVHVLEKERAITLEAAGQYAAAAEAAQSALTAYPACDHCWRLYSRLLARYLPHHAVLAQLQRLQLHGSTPAKVLASRGIALELMGAKEAALHDYNTALSAEPDLVPALLRRGNLLKLRGDLVGARADFDAAVAADPVNDSALFARAFFFKSLPDLPAAIAEFESIATRDPAKHRAYNALARCHIEMENFAEAMVAIEKALRIYADCDDCWELYGLASERAYGANALGELFLALVPDADAGATGRVMAARGRALLNLGSFENANRELTKAIESAGSDAGLYKDRARARAGMRCFAGAASDIGIAIQLLGEDGKRLQNQRGLWLSYDGCYADAIAAFEASKNGDCDVIALYNIAIASSRLKGPQNAQPEILAARSSLDLAMKNEETKGVGTYGLAGVSAIEGRIEEALAFLKSALVHTSDALNWAAEDVAWYDIRSTPAFCELLENAKRMRK